MDVTKRIMEIINATLKVQVVLCILGLLILFGPEQALTPFGLTASSITGIWRTLIGLITLASGLSIIAWAIEKTVNAISRWLQFHKTEAELVQVFSSLSSEEKIILFQAIKVNMPQVMSPIDNPFSNSLFQRGILVNPTHIFGKMGAVTFYISSTFWELLKKHKDKIFKECYALSEDGYKEALKKIITIGRY